MTANNDAGKKVLRITCKDDGAAGSAQSYQCNWKWKVRSADNAVHNLTGSFVITRGQPETVVYEEYRFNGSELDDEIDGFQNSCSAQ